MISPLVEERVPGYQDLLHKLTYQVRENDYATRRLCIINDLKKVATSIRSGVTLRCKDFHMFKIKIAWTGDNDTVTYEIRTENKYIVQIGPQHLESFQVFLDREGV